MEKAWMTQLVRALAIIPIVAMLHGVVTATAVFLGLGLSLESFDKGIGPSVWGQAATRIVDLLIFPMGQVIEHRGYTSPTPTCCYGPIA